MEVKNYWRMVSLLLFMMFVGSMLNNRCDHKEEEVIIRKPLTTVVEHVEEVSELKKVVCTVYNAVPEQCNSDPGHTASMFELDLKNPYKHRIIAVSRNMLKEYPMGTKVRLKGTNYDGIYTVEDKMNRRFVDRIDILINVGMKIGKWNNVTIEKL